MTGRRSIFMFWLLILVPAVILAGAAVRQLSLEQERIKTAAVRALTERGRAMAESVDLAVTTVEDNLTRSLLELDGASLEPALLRWEKVNSLVRNVFVYHPQGGLGYPSGTLAATAEERAFVRRFEPFFTGRMPFDLDRVPGDSNQQVLPPEPVLPAGVPSARKSLYALSRVPEKTTAGRVQGRSGWIPWFSENRLHILGWVQKLPDGPVYGVELELMTFLSRLAAEFPVNRQAGTCLALLDGAGDVLLRSGPLEPEDFPLARIAVSSRLPHWQVAVYAEKIALSSGRSFFVIAWVLTGILVVSILSGGLMMTRLALQKMRDARQKTSFVASVSHELKTPLTSIRMYAELLMAGRVTDPLKQERYLSVIVAESLRLTRLINNVLSFGRLEQGRKTYHRTSFDLAVFLDALIRDQEVRMAGLTVRKTFHPGDFRVNTDRDAVGQALLNLIDNALKYAGQGRFLEFVLDRDGADVRVSLRDDGPGVDRALRKKIFDRFFRADDSITARKPGSGLGLSIARQMLRDLDGDLVLDDLPPGETGACFTMRIPHED